MFAFLGELAGLSRDEVLAVLLADQRYRWKSAGGLRVEDYLKQLPDLGTDPGVKLQLVQGEYQAREAAGATPTIDDYIARFADLTGPLQSRFSETSVADETLVGEPRDLIDDLCDEFEEGWVDGGEPSLDEFLENGPGVGRGRLLTELLQVELWWRQKRDEQPDLEAYCSRYPNHVESVRAAFGLPPVDEALDETVVFSRDAGNTVRRKLDDRQYRVVDEVARGGMGVVHRVWDDSLGRHVAMKVIRGQDEIGSSPVDSIDSATYQRFVREAEITGQLDHPGVVPIHELGVDERNRTYFTMRLIDGDNLHHIYQLVKDEQSSWTQTRAVGVIINVCDTIAFAHSRNIIHRDLKPANVMVGQFGETYVMDWGLAKARGTPADNLDDAKAENTKAVGSGSCSIYPHDETMDGSILGTPAYMPPEQAAGKINMLDDRSDVYSIGAMLYELLAGNRPYKDLDPPPRGLQLIQTVVGQSPTSLSVLDPKCPAELVAICEKAMARSQSDRYATAQEMSEDLRAYREGRVVQAHRTGPWIELRKWIGRNRALSTAMVSAVLIAIAGLGAVISIERSKNEELKTANEKTTKERNHAQSLYFAQRAKDAIQADPALALLLAQESLRLDTNATSRTAFYTAAGSLDEKRTLIGHSGEVWRAEFSPDGTRVVTTSDDSTAALWDVASGKRIAVWDEHAGQIRRVAWSPDGRLVATTDFDQSGRNERLVIVRDANTGVPKWNHTDAGFAWSLDFTADSRQLLTPSTDGKVYVWDSHSGREVKVLDTGRDNRIARFSPDGSSIAVGTTDGTVLLYDRETWSSRTIRNAGGGVDFLQFSKTGNRLITSDLFFGTAGPSVNVWDPRTCQRIAYLEHPNPITAVVLSGDGLTVATGQQNGNVTVWSVGDSISQSIVELAEPINFIDFSDDDRQIVACVGNRACWWNPANPDSIRTLKGHGGTVVRACFNTDASLLLTCSADRTARLWATGMRRLIPDLRAGQAQAYQAHVTSAGDFICRGSGKTAWLWSVKSDEVLPLRHPTDVLMAVPLESGGLVTQCATGLHFWSRRGKLLKTVEGMGKAARVLASAGRESAMVLDESGQHLTEFSAEGNVVASYSLPPASRQSSDSPFVWLQPMDTEVRLHHLKTDAVVTIPKPTTCRVHRADGGLAIIGPGAGGSPTQVWSMESGKLQATLADSSGPALANVKVVGNGTRLIASSLEKPSQIRTWNAETGHRLPNLDHVGSYVSTVVLSKGNLVITIDDQAVRLWDIKTATLRSTLSEHLKRPAYYALDPTEQFFAVHDADNNTINVWQLTDQELWCEIPVATAPKSLQFGPANNLMVVGQDASFRLWQLTAHQSDVDTPRSFSKSEAAALDLLLVE